MSDREIEIDLTDSVAKTLSDVPPTEAEVAGFKARLVQVFERGLIVDRLHVDLPPHLHGEWVSRDPAEIYRMELLGFEIDKEYAVKRKLNDKADGSAIVGDVVYMVQPKWKHDLFEAKRQEVYFTTHMKKHQKEEQDFKANQASIGEDKNSTISSQAENLPGHEITQRLVAKQT